MRTSYTDEVEFDAGPFDAFAKPMVTDFFKQRQRHLKKLLADDSRYWSFASIASQIFAPVSVPLKASIDTIPVGEVTLISVR